MKKLLIILVSFILGTVIATCFTYNLFYGSLVYTQLQRSTLTLTSLNENKVDELKNSALRVFLPIEICKAIELTKNPIFVDRGFVTTEIDKGFELLQVPQSNRDKYCSEKTN